MNFSWYVDTDYCLFSREIQHIAKLVSLRKTEDQLIILSSITSFQGYMSSYLWFNFADKMFLFAGSNKDYQHYMTPCKELCNLNKSEILFSSRFSWANGLKRQSKGYIQRLFPPPLPPLPPSWLPPSGGSFSLGCLSPSFLCFHSPTTLVHTGTTLIVFKLIPSYSSCPFESISHPSHRLTFLQHRSSSSPFPLRNVYWFLSPHLIVSKSQNQILQNTTISGVRLIFECKVSHTHDYVHTTTYSNEIWKRFLTSMA